MKKLKRSNSDTNEPLESGLFRDLYRIFFSSKFQEPTADMHVLKETIQSTLFLSVKNET